jgi:hypothetical protein
MRTLKPLPPLPKAVQAQQGLGAWLDVSKPKPVRKASKSARSSKGYDQAREQAEVFAKSNTWGDAEPKHLVGLYVLLHEQVYRVPPTELKDAWKGAVSATKSMLEKEFAGNVVAYVEFIRWTWQRERRREDRRRAEGAEGSRIGWVLQFKSRTMLTDYRVEVARAQESAKPKGKR